LPKKLLVPEKKSKILSHELFIARNKEIAIQRIANNIKR
jgi:hypothetical protein